MKDLNHLLEVSAAFEDVTLDFNDYLRDVNEIELSSTSIWYIGLYKPFKKFYFESNKFNTNSLSSLNYEYWDGSAWQSLPNLRDNTKNLARSGFIEWEFADNSKITDSWIANAVNGLTKYWVRVTSNVGAHSNLISNAGVSNTETIANIADEDIANWSVDQYFYAAAEDSYHRVTAVDTTMGAANITFTPALVSPLPDNEPLYSRMQVAGANIVYADDLDLLQEVRLIYDYRAENDTSFIAYHVSARNDIVQTVRNGGDIKIVNNEANPLYEQMNKWDFLETGEIRQAAKYLCLAKIFFDVSENIEDKARSMHDYYMGKYGEAFKLWFRTLDLDDDGNTDDVETTNNGIINFHKV